MFCFISDCLTASRVAASNAQYAPAGTQGAPERRGRRVDKPHAYHVRADKRNLTFGAEFTFHNRYRICELQHEGHQEVCNSLRHRQYVSAA